MASKVIKTRKEKLKEMNDEEALKEYRFVNKMFQASSKWSEKERVYWGNACKIVDDELKERGIHPMS